jgi:ferredoxin-NADP reductase
MNAPILPGLVRRGMTTVLEALGQTLATPHGVDRYLEMVNPMLAVREVRGEVVDVRKQTAGSVTLRLRPNRAWRGFQPGQYVRVSVDVGAVRHTRCYSPATSVHQADGTIELTIATHPHGVLSGYLRDNARPGMVLALSQAEGTFLLPRPRPRDILLISGGSGITPVLSMLRTLRDEGHRGRYMLLHYARKPADVPYRDELRSLASAGHVARAYTRARGGRLAGHLTRAHLADAAPWYRDAQIYVCGPPGLLRVVRDLCAEDGIIGQLHTEEFVPARGPLITPAVGGLIAFTRSQVRVANTGDTLLEQAERAGLAPAHGCRMGICLSCTQVKRSGQVRDLRTGARHCDADEEIQMCVSVPIGDVAIEC